MTLGILTTRARLAAGDSASGLAAGVRAGRLTRLRPGAFVVTDAWHRATPRVRHRAAMDALLLTARRAPVFARESAALLHDIPVIGEWPERPHLLDSELTPASRRSPREAIVHRPRHLPDIVEVGGLRATAPVDTALALAASRPIVGGVVALDHVLARGADLETVVRTVDEWRPFHGAGRVSRALELANGLAETPLESLSLVGILLGGLPEPRQQFDVVARGCRYRLDFFWPESGVVGEADGRGKYLTTDDLWREKQREDDLRATGLTVARWDWDDAWARAPMLAKLARAGVHPAPQSSRYSAGLRRSNVKVAE